MQLLPRLRGVTLALRAPSSSQIAARLVSVLALGLALVAPAAAHAALELTGPGSLTLPRTGSTATITAARLENVGATTTNSLRFELWLFPGAAPANVADFASANLALFASVSNLLPAQFLTPLARVATASPVPAGTYTPVLAISEFIGGVWTPQDWLALPPRSLSFPVPPPSTFFLTTSVAPGGAGTLSRVPDLPQYQPGDVVTITAAPTIGQTIQSWTGCSQTTATTCTVTMTTDITVNANFLPAATSVTLTTNASPANGGGFVQVPELYAHPVNATVSVTAVPAAGFVFQSWSGCTTTNGTQCNVTLDTNRAVTASFAPQAGQPAELFGLLPSRPSGTQSNLVRVNRTTGAVTPYPQWSAIGAAAFADTSFGADGSLVAIVQNDRRLVRIDRTSFQLTTLATLDAVPSGIDVDGSGRITALTPGQLVRFDPATGIVTSVATGPLLAPAQPADPIDFAVADDGTAFVLRQDTVSSPATAQIVRVNAANGQQTPLVTSASLAGAVGPVLGADDALYAWSRLQSPGVRRIDPATGVVSPSAFPNDPNPQVETLATALDGALLAVTTAAAPVPLQRIDLDSGARSQITTLAGTQGAGFRLVGEAPPVGALLSVARRRVEVPVVAGSQGARTLFALRNAGLASLDYTVQRLPGAAWPAPGPASGTLAGGAKQLLTTSFDARGLAVGARYPGRVRVTHVGSPAAPIEVAVDLVITATPAIDAGALTTSLPSPQIAGTTVQLTAAATGGTGAYEYKFWSSPDGGASWTVLREWGVPTFDWRPLSGSAQQIVAFWVRRAGSTADAPEDYTLLSYPITAAPPVAVSALNANKVAPQNSGTTIQLTATATGGPGGHDFKWWVTPDGGASWQVLREWGSGSLTWVPITGSLATQVAVWVRPTGSTVDAYADFRILPFGINPAPPISLGAIQASLVSPQPAGTPITLSTLGAGGTGSYEYKWWGSPDGGATWQQLRDWGSASFDWTPVVGSASWLVGAWVRTTGSTADSAEAFRTLGYQVNAPPALVAQSLTPSLASPRTVGTPMNLQAAATGGVGPLQYKFWVSPDGGASWSVIRDWGTDTAPWTPTTAGASTRLAVWVRSAGVTADAAQAFLVVSYTVNAAPPIQVTDITTSLPSTTAGTPVTLGAVATGGVGPLQYKFWSSPNGGASWSVVRDWGSNSVLWTPTMAGTNGVIAVWARSAISTADAAEAFRTEAYVVNAAQNLVVTTITPDLPAPQLPGTTISLQAASSGGVGPVQYKWWASPDGGASWSVLREWGSDTVSWTPIFASVRWTIAVWARSAGQTADAYESYRLLTYHVRPFAPPAPLDFNGDGTSDLMGWDPAVDPEVVIGLVSGGVVTDGDVVASIDASWEVIPFGDANADGKADLVWHQALSRQTYVWYMNGAAIAGSLRLPDAPAGAELLASGDFDGDGDPDLLWWTQNTGNVTAWLLAGATKTEAVIANVPGAQAPNGCVADFDDDGKEDVLWENAGGVPALYLVDGLTVRSQTPLPAAPSGHELPGACPDLTGDRRADVLWDATAGGSGIAWVMSGAQILGTTPISYGGPGRNAVPLGDYDGDGGIDLLWFTDAGDAGVLFLDGTNVVGSSTLFP